MKLKHDVRSYANPKKIYGFKGEEVTELSRHDHVIIVKGKLGMLSITEEDLEEEHIKPIQSQSTLF